MNIFLRNEKGLTIVELLAVIVIIGILYLELVPRLSFIGDIARETGIKSDFRTFQASAEAYLRESVGKSLTENGLNSLMDGDSQFSSGASKLLDPWKQPYRMQFKTVSPTESLIIFRSSGKDTASDSLANLFKASDSGNDLDDYFQVSHYKNGVVKTCSRISKNDNSSVKFVTTTLTGTVSKDMNYQLFLDTYNYVYAIDSKFSYYGAYRSYIMSNQVLELEITNRGSDNGFVVKDKTGKTFYARTWWQCYGGVPGSLYDCFYTANDVGWSFPTTFETDFGTVLNMQQVQSGMQISGCD